MRAMILAAGLGTRLMPLTENKPKALVEIKGTPLLEIIINKLKSEGFTDIIINVHHFGNQIVEFLKSKNNFNINIQISDETDKLLDTGGGIYNAKWFLEREKSFLVYNVDIISDINLQKMYWSHIQTNALVTLAVKERETSRILQFDTENNQLCRWKNLTTGEKKISRQSESNLYTSAFSGIHILNSDIFNLITEKGSFSIIDTYLRLAKDYKIISYQHDNSSWFDLGRYEHVLNYNKF
ncbi:MAG: nucleotidyltransferase family protein [Bacteroidales bacterium]|nr:nucleotidyltransferase family protein [Bacteroidales bacterium]MBN2758033.1 nucleotidyltransferase family protein [Bacteroidales bacterium]